MGWSFLTPSEVSAREIVDYCKSLADDLMKEHEKRFAERIRAIRDASSNLANAANRFESGVRNAWGTMDKARTEYGTRLAQSIQETALRLSRVEPEPKFRGTEKFHEESVATLNQVILTVRRYIPKLHKGLKSEIAALNTALAKLEIAVRALGTTLDDSPGAKVESLQGDAERLQQRQDELEEARAEEAQQVSSLKKLSEREQEFLKRQQELTSQGEFLELLRYEESLRSKEEEIRQFFQPVTKPLIKLERAAAAKQIASIDVKILQSLIENPVSALSTAQSFAVVHVMGQLDEALSSRRLDIEERKLRKARDTIEEARHGAVETLREDYLTIQANLQETLRQLRAKGLLEKRDEVHRLMAETRRERENLEARHRETERKTNEIDNELLKQKKAIELQVAKLARKTLTVKVE